MITTAGRSNAQPVIAAMSILAAAQFFFAGAGLADVIGARWAFMGMLVVGSCQVGIQFWVKASVVAVDNVVAYVDPRSDVVAGPAMLGIADGVAVELEAI